MKALNRFQMSKFTLLIPNNFLISNWKSTETDMPVSDSLSKKIGRMGRKSRGKRHFKEMAVHCKGTTVQSLLIKALVGVTTACLFGSQAQNK
jgi:hypothetical protein